MALNWEDGLRRDGVRKGRWPTMRKVTDKIKNRPGRRSRWSGGHRRERRPRWRQIEPTMEKKKAKRKIVHGGKGDHVKDGRGEVSESTTTTVLAGTFRGTREETEGGRCSFRV